MQSDNIVTSPILAATTQGSVPEGSTYVHVTTEKQAGPWRGIGDLLCGCWAPTGPWSTKAIRALGITHIILGVLHVIPQIILLLMHSIAENYLGFCGIIFIVTGVALYKKKINKLHVSILILMSVVAIVLTIVILACGRGYMENDQGEYMFHMSLTMNDTTGVKYYDYYNYDYDANYYKLRIVIAQHGLIMAFACLELIAALVSFGFICRSLRFRSSSPTILQKTYLIQMPTGETSPVMVPVIVPSDLQSVITNEGSTEKNAHDGLPPYTRLEDTFDEKQI